MRGIKSCTHPHQHRPPLQGSNTLLFLIIPLLSLTLKPTAGIDPSSYHTSLSYFNYASSSLPSSQSLPLTPSLLQEDETSELTPASTNDPTAECPDNLHCICEFQESFNLTCSDTTFNNIQLPWSVTSIISFKNISAQSSLLAESSSLSSLLLNKLSASLVKLSWTMSDVNGIDSGTFQGFRSLESVDLSYNKIKYLPNNHLFPDHPPSLVSLNLTGNMIQYLNMHVFENLTGIREILLGENQLATLPTGLFSSLAELKTVNLSCNMLQSLENMFQNTTNLENLILYENKIRHISSTAFGDLRFLKILDLSMNNIESLDPTVFQDLVSLEHLNLMENKLSYIYPSLFHSLNNAKSLDISFNPLTSLSGGIFSSCRKLEELHISNTALHHIYNDDLNGLISLQVLNISKNADLSTIDNGAFINTFKLVMLDLSENNLKVLPGSVSSCCSKMQNIVLRGNPWRCGCDMMWVADWLNSRLLVQDSLIVEDDGNLMRCDYNNQTSESYFNKNMCSVVELVQATLYHRFHLGSSALLECNFSGNPQPAITWVTPFRNTFHWSPDYVSVFVRHPMAHDSDLLPVDSTRVHILENGNLYIDEVHWDDCGKYICFASNSLGNVTVYLTLSVDPAAFLAVKMISLAVGVATGTGFLLLTMGLLLLRWIFHKLGWPWCCKNENVSPKTQHLKQLLENIEQYRAQQLDKLRENYYQQVHRIRDNCTQQVDWIRESYASQVQHIRDIRDYGTHHLTSMRDQYYDQVKRVRDYSTHQLCRVRDNYLQQRKRVRKFSAHQMLRLRENCKYQQQTLNKILENLPSLYVDNCRSSSTGRSDSIIFDAEIIGIDMYIKSTIKKLAAELDETNSTDSPSCVSVYYTPTERSIDIPCESPTDKTKRYSSSTNTSSELPPSYEVSGEDVKQDEHSLSSSDNVRATSTPKPRKKLKRTKLLHYEGSTFPPLENTFPVLPFSYDPKLPPVAAEIDLPRVFKCRSHSKRRERLKRARDSELCAKSASNNATDKDREWARPEEVVLLMENKPVDEDQSDVKVCMKEREKVIVHDGTTKKHTAKKEYVEPPLPPVFETAL